MRRRAIPVGAVVLCSALLSCHAQPGGSGSVADRSAIRQVCLDYAEGFYEGNASRLRSALHPKLVKRTAQDGKLETLSREKLIRIATEEEREKPRLTARVVAVHDGIATAKVVSKYVDYVQLAKLDGEWKIVNVLWKPK